MAKRKSPSRRKSTPKKTEPPQTIPLNNDAWKQNFCGATMRTSFTLSLSQAMIEFLCAVADGVQWDRGMYYPNIHNPDNRLATERALRKRGLVVRKCRQVNQQRKSDSEIGSGEYSHCELTPAGHHLVELFKVTGLFAEADAAITKKARS